MTDERMWEIIKKFKAQYGVRRASTPRDWRQLGYIAYAAPADAEDDAQTLDDFVGALEEAGVPIAADVEQHFIPHSRGGEYLVAFIKFGSPERAGGKGRKARRVDSETLAAEVRRLTR